MPSPIGQALKTSDAAWPDWCRIVLLLGLAVALRGWGAAHSAVPARDGLTFVRYAWELRHHRAIDVLRGNHHPPGYPLAILAAAAPLRHWTGSQSEDILQPGAQLAAALAGILLVVPMYFLGRDIFDQRTGFWTAALFQCLPVSARVLSDTLSEPQFLLAAATALYLAVSGFRRPSVWRFLLCGACAGAAYLTRPEGMLLIAAVSLTLACHRWLAPAEWPWRKLAGCALSLWVGAAVLAGPYIGVIGRLTQKPTGQRVFEVALETREKTTGAGRLLVAMWAPDDEKNRAACCPTMVLSETAKTYHYAGIVLLPLGLWWFRDRFRGVPGTMVLPLLGLLDAALLVRVALVSGYVSERHTLLLLLCGLYWVVAAVGAAGDRLSDKLAGSEQRWGAVTLLLLFTVSGLPSALRPLHQHRCGFRAAGRWLAEHASAADAIIDPFGWASHYAGRTYQDYAPPMTGAVNRFFVWDCSKPSYQRAQVDAARVQELKQGQPVFQWPKDAPPEKAAVVVYFLPADSAR